MTRGRERGRRWLVCAAAVLAAGVASRPVAAEITEAKRYTFDTAYTVNRGEVLIGLGAIEVGIADGLSLGTVFLGDLFGIYNVYGKLNVLRDEADSFRLSVHGGYVYFDSDYSVFRFLLPEDARLLMSVAFFGPLVSFKLSPIRYLHASATWAQVFAKAETEAVSISVAGALVYPNVQVMYEHDFAGGNALLTGASALYAVGLFAPTVFASYVFGWPRFHIEIGAGLSGSVSRFVDPISGATSSAVAYGLAPRFNLWWRL